MTRGECGQAENLITCADMNTAVLTNQGNMTISNIFRSKDPVMPLYFDRYNSQMCKIREKIPPKSNVLASDVVVLRFEITMEKQGRKSVERFYLYNKVTDGLSWFAPREGADILRIKMRKVADDEDESVEMFLVKEKILSVTSQYVEGIIKFENYSPGGVFNGCVCGEVISYER